MNSKERVIRTLEFNGPDRLPLDLWVLSAAKMEYGTQLDKICEKYEFDIVSLVGPFDHGFSPEYYLPGKFIDPWGSEWTNIQAGLIGEVKNPVFADYTAMKGYVNPVTEFGTQFDANATNLQSQIDAARKADKFIIGGWISIFERMQYLRGTEELFCDIAMEEDDMFEMINIVMEYMREYVKRWLALDIDAMAFGDDWGTQISMLISPDTWRAIFRPLYSELIDMIKAAGKKVFFHSDGYIYSIYSDLIEMGVDAVNSQLWCMGVEKVAEKYAGKITFWGEVSRQTTLPSGTPDDIRADVAVMKKNLYANGGLIGQSEINRDVPLANIEALLEAWNH